ncbi:uncharacterized protein LOC143143552 [Ptiloglossa arizonensis]|uniref:uncharacterized protein LOC143143552 n=1 Tax=Ptiloglossa arizonensis TaxID=3350558 RepID=UPI003F9ECC05
MFNVIEANQAFRILSKTKGINYSVIYTETDFGTGDEYFYIIFSVEFSSVDCPKQIVTRTFARYCTKTMYRFPLLNNTVLEIKYLIGNCSNIEVLTALFLSREGF